MYTRDYMNFKNVLLSALLLPAMMCGTNNDTAIKELEEAQFKKELEISKIGKMIAEIDTQMRSFWDNHAQLLKELKNLKKAVFREENENKQLSEDEINKLSPAIEEDVSKFIDGLNKICEKQLDLNDYLIKELIHNDAIFTAGKFSSLKFFVLKFNFERKLLEKLVRKYGFLMNELIAINKRLMILTK